MRFVRYRRTFGLLLVLLVAAGLRFSGYDWDGAHHLHPDERFLSMVATAEGWPDSGRTYLDEARSPLNPRNVGFSFFAYGTLPTTLVRAVGVALGRTNIDQLTLIGRSASAAASLGAVLLVFLIGLRVYADTRVALLGALLLSTSVLPIQHAHFFVVDPFAVFFITAATWALAGPPRTYRYPLVGLFFGLALACKLSVATFAIVIGVVAFWDQFDPAASADRPRPTARRLVLAALGGVGAMAAALVAFRLAQPDAFQGAGLFDVLPSARWLQNLATTRDLVSGSIDTPPSIQWAYRTPYWFVWKNLVLWGLGPPLGLTAWVAWSVAAWQVAVHRTRRHLIPVVWVGVLFLHQGGQFAMTGRYLLPIYPMLALLAAWLLVTAWNRAAARDCVASTQWRRATATGLATLVVLSTALWAAAFTAIYRRPNSRVVASDWIYRNVPTGATLATEHWDDALPVPLAGRSPRDFRAVQLTPYDDDTPRKLDLLIQRLDAADYVVLSSNRLYDSIPRLPMRYPMTIRYYDALFSGALGFERVADVTSYPSLGPLQVPDQDAEEAFSVYDHARVQIFRKTSQWSPSRARALLGSVDWEGIIRLPPVRARAFGTGLMLSPAERDEARAAGTWSRIFPAGTLGRTWPVPVWVLALELLGLAAFPLTALALGRLPDRGWLLAKGVGLLLLGYGAWLSASVRWLPFTRGSLVAIALVMAATSAFVVWRRRPAFVRILRERWALILGEECLFWIAFGGLLLVRMGNPDLWHPNFGGEKPMDFAYLNAVVKSDYFPPYDPWFAGGYLNYYYYGFVLVGSLVKLTGIVPAVAYNLAVATLFALTAAATFSVVHALVSSLDASPGGDGHQPRSGGFAFLGGMAGVLFVAVLGNLVEVRLLTRTLWEGRWSQVPLSEWFWTATRAIPSPANEAGPITEFPFFTFLYGDLHAHAMGLPFTILVLALVVCLVLPPSSPDAADPTSPSARFWLLALALGALFPMNAWDYPTYASIVAAGVLYGRWLHSEPKQPLATLAGRAVLQVVAVLAVGRVLFWPFFARYGQAYGAFEGWNGSGTSVSAYLLIHGLFLFLIGSAVVWLAASRGSAVRKSKTAAAAIGLAGILGATGVLLTVVVEIIVMAGDVGRMNTVFKFYLQVWVLLSIAAATGLALIVGDWWYRPRSRSAWTDAAGSVWIGIVGWLVVSSAVYPVVATWARWRDRFASEAGFTLDGEAFMRTAVHVESETMFPLAPDLDAIDWLRSTIDGTPVIAEAHMPEYHWGSRISVHTGLPTILGWRYHETQQRALLPADVVARRARDVDELYRTTDTASAMAILSRYHVEYVYVGPLERILYPEEGLAKFGGNLSVWVPVYNRDDVVIYRVDTVSGGSVARLRKWRGSPSA
ncbi:MAG: glycosyltransferase family 39 protein [Acidobacteria bacterium]|nr:glycosyltransferase family 39 protein [Acidobacteriota bacterium]